MSIHKLYKRMVNRRKQAMREFCKPKKWAYRQMAMLHVDHIDKHLPSIEKASKGKGKSA